MTLRIDRWGMDHVEMIRRHLDRQVMPASTQPVFAPRMNDLYDPASGQQGTNSGTVELREYYARRLQPAGDLVSYTSPYDWNGNPGTLCAWVNIDGFTMDNRWWRGVSASPAGGGFFIGTVTTSSQIRFWHQHGTTSLARVTAAVMTEGTWSFVTVDYPGDGVAANVHIRVDLVEPSYVTTTDGAGTPENSNGTWSIGYAGAPSVSLLGNVAFLEFYPAILTANERLALYQERRAFFA